MKHKSTTDQVKAFAIKQSIEAGYDIDSKSEYRAKFLVSVLENKLAEILEKHNLTMDPHGSTKNNE